MSNSTSEKVERYLLEETRRALEKAAAPLIDLGVLPEGTTFHVEARLPGAAETVSATVVEGGGIAMARGASEPAPAAPLGPWVDGWCTACGAPETEANEHQRLVRVHRARCPHGGAPEHPAVTLLREIEWPAYEHLSGDEGECPICRNFKSAGHAPGCRLAAILSGSADDFVAAERDACAQVVDQWDGPDAGAIANAIRERGAR